MTRGNPTKASSRYAKTTSAALELVNPGTAGIVYDEAGNSVGGGERVTLDGDPDHVAMRQLGAGYLLAVRGDTWLTVRDGHLVDPAGTAKTSTDTVLDTPNEEKNASGASTTTPAPRSETIRPNE